MGVDWQLSGKPGVPDVELQIAMRQLERSRLRQERFCLSFWLSCAHPLGLRSSAWLIALATPASFRFTSPDRLGPFPSSSRCCPVAVGTPVVPAPPAQIRTGSIAAYGSYLGYLALKRMSG